MKHINYYKIVDRNKIKLLFLLCWVVYFSTYLGRLNYTAALSEIVESGSLTKAQGGLIGTIFFFAYGIGQLVSGFLGDKFSPKWLVFNGTLISGFLNLAMFHIKNPTIMLVIWGINGCAQALIWSPMIRLLFEYLKMQERIKCCISLNSSVPIGSMTAYGMTAIIIYLLSWNWVFQIAGIFLIGMAFIWIFTINHLENYAIRHGELEEMQQVEQEQKEITINSLWSLLCRSGLVVILFVLMIQGVLKDGITTWIPTYINETYFIGSILSIVGTMVIPIFNLLGIYLASIINRTWFHNEISTAGCFFGFCAVSLILLWAVSGKSVIISFVMLTVATTSMMAVNTMLIAVLPSYFGTMGRASSISGVLNSFVYMGGAFSTYGIGTLSNSVGWKITILGWILFAIMATIICFAQFAKWNVFCTTCLLQENKVNTVTRE